MEDTKTVLSGLLNETENLQRQNREMSLRLEMFDNVMSIIYSSPPSRTQGVIHPCPIQQAKTLLKKLSDKEQAKTGVGE